MTDVNKELETKAINIKGKKYILVSDRILAFNELYPNGCIQTQLVSTVESKTIVIRATVTPDVDKPGRSFSDYSQAVIGQGMVNQTAALENASTSAVGRCLAYMGIGVIESIASADEMVKSGAYNAPRTEVDNGDRDFCEKCGKIAQEKSGISKLGKPYRAVFCSTKDMTHTKWLKVEEDEEPIDHEA